MGKQRTVITATKDGSVLVTLETHVGVGGSAKDRKKERRRQEREGLAEEDMWRVVDRVISAELPMLPTKAASWPGLTDIHGSESLEHSLMAAENEQVARRFKHEAAQIAAEIDARNNAPEVKAVLKPMRVILEAERILDCGQPDCPACHDMRLYIEDPEHPWNGWTREEHDEIRQEATCSQN